MNGRTKFVFLACLGLLGGCPYPVLRVAPIGPAMNSGAASVTIKEVTAPNGTLHIFCGSGNATTCDYQTPSASSTIVLRPEAANSAFGAWLVATPTSGGFNWNTCSMPGPSYYPPTIPGQASDCGWLINENTYVFASFLSNSVPSTPAPLLSIMTTPGGAPLANLDGGLAVCPSTGTSCPHFPQGRIAVVKLGPNVAQGGVSYQFSGWSSTTSNCTAFPPPNGSDCVIAIQEDTTVTSAYTRFFDLEVKLEGPGRVESTNVAGIDCSLYTTGCFTAFPEGHDVVLSAINPLFAGWSGPDCEHSGTGSCTVHMTAPKTGLFAITAKFRRPNITVNTTGPAPGLVDLNGVDVIGECGPNYVFPRNILHAGTNQHVTTTLPDDCSYHIQITASPPRAIGGRCSAVLGGCLMDMIQSQDETITVNF